MSNNLDARLRIVQFLTTYLLIERKIFIRISGKDANFYLRINIALNMAENFQQSFCYTKDQKKISRKVLMTVWEKNIVMREELLQNHIPITAEEKSVSISL